MIFKFGGLFCGPGGLAWASKNASINFNNEQFSIQHAWATDYDRDTCDTYRANICPKMPETVICKDIRKLDYSKLEKISSVDAIAFGFPCNDFSVVGEQKGINGVYGPLYSYGVKAVSKFKPKWFLAENVGGLRNANDGSAFTKILQSLFDEGYSVYPHLYKFEKYGVPQARHRIIIVGIRKDLNVSFNIPSSNGYTVKSCREAIEEPPINKNVSNQEFTKHSKSVLERLKYIKPGENAFTADIPEHLQLNVKGAKISQIYKRLDPNKPAYTVTGSGGGGTHVYHWKENRALTNRERARLQTFPDNFTFCGSKESVRKQIGMAVPPQGVQVVFQAILKSFAGIKYDCEESNITPFLQPEHLTIYNETPFEKQLRLCETQQEFQVCGG